MRVLRRAQAISRSQLLLLPPLPRREPAQLSSEGSVGLTPGARSWVSPRWCRGGWLGEAGLPQLGICSAALDAPAACWQGRSQGQHESLLAHQGSPHPQAPGTHVLSAGPSSSPAHTWPSPCPASPTLHSLPRSSHRPEFSPNSHQLRSWGTPGTHHPRVLGTFHTAGKHCLWNCVLSVCPSWRVVCGALGTAAPRTPRQLHRRARGERTMRESGRPSHKWESLAQAAGWKDPPAAV